MVITVQCTSCSTSFPVDPGKVPAGGVHARCSECGGVFRVERPEETATAPAPAPSPETPGEEPPDFGTGIGMEPEALSGLAEPAEAPPAEEAPPPGAFAAPPEEAPPQISSEEAATEVSDEDFVIEQETLYAEPAVDEAPADESPAAEAPPAAPEEPARPQPSVSFGHRDPKEKAARLARVLVSDMILYNPQRHTKAIESGNLAEEFEDEIKKSWEEYVEQVGPDIAESTPYFTNALNEILAKGEEIF